MRKIFLLFSLVAIGFFFSCGDPATETEGAEAAAQTDDASKPSDGDDFVWNPENFADKKMVRYQIPGFDKLTLKQKKLVYYLTQAGLAGRDIGYDQNYRHNIAIRRAVDKIAGEYKGERTGADWDAFMLYAKNIWFSNGIHHHYSSDKFNPEFSKEYFNKLLAEVGGELNETPETCFGRISGLVLSCNCVR